MPLFMRLARNLASPFVQYGHVAKKWPFTTGVLTTVVKTSIADAFAQKVVENREEIDWKRNGLFTFFGFAYLGCFQFWLYNDVFVRICAPITRVVGHYGAAPVKTFIDQCIHHPLFYFPAFYVCKGAVEGRSVTSSMKKYKTDLWDNCKALWTVWVPAQLINFSVVPLHLRIPFVAGISFAWTVIISVMRGALEDEAPPLGVEAAPTLMQGLQQQILHALPQDPAEVPVMLQHELTDPHPVHTTEVDRDAPSEEEASDEVVAMVDGPVTPSPPHGLSAADHHKTADLTTGDHLTTGDLSSSTQGLS